RRGGSELPLGLAPVRGVADEREEEIELLPERALARAGILERCRRVPPGMEASRRPLLRPEYRRGRRTVLEREIEPPEGRLEVPVALCREASLELLLRDAAACKPERLEALG